MLTPKRLTPHAQGFTIVELLIVIIVIAILAAITIVAYNGIQQRARNSQVISGTNAYLKTLHEYYAVHSQLPTSSGCLGANYPSNQCWVGTSGTWSVNATLDSNLSEFLSTKPTLATSLFSIGIGDNTRAGALYNSSTKQVVYYLQGAGQNCSISGATGVTEGGIVTQCSYAFSY